MHTSNYIYYQGEQEFHGYLAYDDSRDSPRPAVLVAPDWSGRNEFACKKAEMLAQMGYVGFALDMYGQGRIGNTNDEKMALMQPLMNDRALLRGRVCAALDALVTMQEVDHKRIAIIGFCFGGLCALDLARSGAEIKGVVSFHGLLNQPAQVQSQAIQAKVLILQGYDDPMVKPEQISEFCKEMDAAKVDWQVHLYGHVEHAFSNPHAHDKNLGLVYNALASQRSWEAMTYFLKEVL
jgi:dienelactone hydrolase